MNWLEFEQEAINKGYHRVCGIDEAGRGPLAGRKSARLCLR